MQKMLITAAGIGLLSSITAHAQSPREEKIHVAVTILPLAEFVEQIGRERVAVSVMIPPGSNPHTYEPPPRQLREVSRTQLYVKVGSGIAFELGWMDKLASLNKTMRIGDSSEGITLQDIADHRQHEHDKDPEGEEPFYHGKDPHLWLSPRNAIAMVTNIKDALSATDPQNRAFYNRNAESFILQLKSLDTEIKAQLATLRNRSFLVFHPAWGYFASQYDLRQIPIEIGGKEPTAKELVTIIKQAKRLNIRVIFASPQFNTKSAHIIAQEISGNVVLIDPLAKEYGENLRRVAAALIAAYE